MGRNWGGRIGAYLSYWAFLSVGYGAYALPLLALLWGGNRLRQQSTLDGVCRSAGLLGMALIFSLGAGLPNYGLHTAFKLGGWLGIQASNAVLIPYGGRIGSGISDCCTISISSVRLNSVPAAISSRRFSFGVIL